MNLIHVLILSVIEGITEFLPVSSTGHLILVSNILKIPTSSFFTSFEIIIQSGAILAVVVLYRSRLLKQKDLFLKLMAAFLPAAIIGFLLYKLIKAYLLTNPFIPVITLILGGIILLLSDKIVKKDGKKYGLERLSYKNAFIVGMFQVISIVPGVSRSAATIIGGMLTGMDKKSAAEFSFMLAVPTMFAATVLDLAESSLKFSMQESFYLTLGVILSFAAAILGIKFLIRFVEKNSFAFFGVYRILVAIFFYLLLIKRF